jgi:septal ring factor EnvC (AmiA/AmiB activator)
MDASNIATIVISLIASATAVWTNKNANKAATQNAKVNVEAEAYNRARKYDTDTIAHQGDEIKELREANAKLEEEVRTSKARFEEESAKMRKRIDDLERQLRGGTRDYHAEGPEAE